jgi:hypothetical protein
MRMKRGERRGDGPNRKRKRRSVRTEHPSKRR